MTSHAQHLGFRRLCVRAGALAAFVALTSSGNLAPAQRVPHAVPVQDEVPRALRAAIAASSRGLTHGLGAEDALATVRADALVEFNKQLDFIALRVDDDILKALDADTGPDLETVLLAIARDRAKRPAAYKELLAEYGTDKFDPRAFANDGEAARLSPPYDTAEWRLVWEYVLLAPDSGPISRSTRNWGMLPLRALDTIGNEASLPAIMHRFRIAVAASQCNPIDATECVALMRVVAKFPSRRGVAAMLECVNLLDACQETIGQHFYQGAPNQKTYRGLALELLSKPRRPIAAGRAGSWEKAVREFPTTELSKKDRELIEAATASYAEPPK